MLTDILYFQEINYFDTSFFFHIFYVSVYDVHSYCCIVVYISSMYLYITSSMYLYMTYTLIVVL